MSSPAVPVGMTRNQRAAEISRLNDEIRALERGLANREKAAAEAGLSCDQQVRVRKDARGALGTSPRQQQRPSAGARRSWRGGRPSKTRDVIGKCRPCGCIRGAPRPARECGVRTHRSEQRTIASVRCSLGGETENRRMSVERQHPTEIEFESGDFWNVYIKTSR